MNLIITRGLCEDKRVRLCLAYLLYSFDLGNHVLVLHIQKTKLNQQE